MNGSDGARGVGYWRLLRTGVHQGRQLLILFGIARKKIVESYMINL